LLPGLDIVPSPAWLAAWQGYELDQLSQGRSAETIRTRQSAVLILARWATKFGCEPEQVTRQNMLQPGRPVSRPARRR
jgi:hypothetical protein